MKHEFKLKPTIDLNSVSVSKNLSDPQIEQLNGKTPTLFNGNRVRLVLLILSNTPFQHAIEHNNKNRSIINSNTKKIF